MVDAEKQVCDARLVPSYSSPADGSKHLWQLRLGSSDRWRALPEPLASSEEKEAVNKVLVQLGTRAKNLGNIAAIGTQERSRGWNKITAVTCTEWHEKHSGGRVIVLVVTKRDHYLPHSTLTLFRAARSNRTCSRSAPPVDVGPLSLCRRQGKFRTGICTRG